MTGHTKELLCVWKDDEGGFGLVTEKWGEFVTSAFPNDFFDGGTQEGNAERLVACWNALAGLNPAAVASLIEAVGDCPDDFARELRAHAADLPRCIQRDYMRLAADRFDALATALSALRGAQ